MPVSPHPHAAPLRDAAMPPKLLGTYRTPAFDYGDVVTCARRGDVRIVGLSEAPIPWPIGQRLPRGQGAVAGAVRRPGRGGEARVGRRAGKALRLAGAGRLDSPGGAPVLRALAGRGLLVSMDP